VTTVLAEWMDSDSEL